MKTQINKRLFQLGSEGLETGVFCGISAVVSVRQKGKWIRGEFSGGTTRFGGQGCAIEPSTLFDLASLTKPLCTTLVILHLIGQGKLAWETPLGRSYPSDKQNIKIENILQHASGLPAYHHYYRSFAPLQSSLQANQLLQCIVNEPLIYPTGTTCLYSDLGFILLGNIAEQRAELSLEALFRTQIVGPLGLESQLRFLPIGGEQIVEMDAIAATEHCPWRQKIIQGEVHDEHAWLMGGVAGHAGLFGTAEAVVRFCECLLDIWKGRSIHPGFPSELLCHALESKNPQGGWCLGFDTPSPGISSSGRYFSKKSVGHLGFSGTSFWIDPEKEVVVVVLTNRVHPSRKNVKIRIFRPWFHDKVMETVLGKA
jgi:CubicO group peptidase (beta-lactamase class C family)